MQNQLNVFLGRCLSTLRFFFMEASVKGDSERVSHTRSCHFCTHELPSRNCVSDLPFKVGGKLVSVMLSASYSFVCLFLFLREKFRVRGRK